MLVFNKLFCQIDDDLNFNAQIQQVFGLGKQNQLYKKYGLSKNAKAGIVHIIDINLEYDIEYYILKRRSVSFPLKQEIKENIQKKIVKRIYQGYRHEIGLPVHGQRTHSNSKTVKKTFNKNIVMTSGFKTTNLFKRRTLKKKVMKKLMAIKESKRLKIERAKKAEKLSKKKINNVYKTRKN